MRTGAILACLLWWGMGQAAEKMVRGTVTYLAGGSVYTSLGRGSGVQDSTLLYVIKGRDTTAELKVYAVSSKSSVCRVLSALRPIVLGDEVWGRVVVVEEQQPGSGEPQPERASGEPLPSPQPVRSSSLAEQGPLTLQGRVSAQYFTSLYENAAFNIAQPGIVVNLRGALRDVPLRMEALANVRSLSVGQQSPFSKRAVNQSRIYGLSVTYDDGARVFSAGRIIPVYAPSLGYVDGIMASARFGSVLVGTTLGYQPDFTLRSISTEYKKFALFVQVLPSENPRLSVSTAYARTYYRSALDREVASVLLNASIGNTLFVYGNVETDFRKKSGHAFKLSPQLTSAYVNLTYRIAGSLSVGLGADASRPYYSFRAIRDVPDSLLVDELRSGMSLSVNWFLPAGIALANTYMPRNAPHAAFGREYSNTSSLTFNDILSSGIAVRSNFNLHANRYTNASGYGVAVQRTFGELFDLTARFQRSGYTIRQTGQRDQSTTVGADLLVFLNSALTLMTTYDRLQGYGLVSNSIFAELSVRF